MEESQSGFVQAHHQHQIQRHSLGATLKISYAYDCAPLTPRKGIAKLGLQPDSSL